MKKLTQKRSSLGFIAGVMSKKSLLFLTAVFLLLGVAPVSAEEESTDKAEFGFEAYMWMSTLKQTTATGDSITIPFGNIVKNLDFTFMLRGSARKDRFFGAADVIYLKMSKNQKHDGEFLGQPIEGKLEVGIKSWVVNLVGGYELISNEKDQFGLTAGARLIDLTLDTALENEQGKRKNSVGGKKWDGVFGFAGRHNYPDGHYFNYYADVGGGESKLTWQAQANFAYDYKKFTGIIGYRYLKWNFKNDSPVDDMTIHGPYLGAKWSW